MRSFLIIIAAAFLYTNATAQAGKEPKTKVYTNAKIWTGNSDQPWANTMVTRGKKIIYISTKPYKYQSSSYLYYNLNGKLVVPGFIDNHTHFIDGGAQISNVQLRNVKSKKTFIATVKNYMANQNESHWIQGGNWNHEEWGGEMPTRKWIDSITKDYPVFLWRYDAHMALANSAALKLAGITANTPNPQGGEIEKDINGEPTGILKDAAMMNMFKIIPPPSEQQLAKNIANAQQEAYKNGVTQICDMSSYGGWLDIEAYKNAYSNNQTKLRVYLFVPIATWPKLDSLIKADGKGDDMLRWGGVKGFADGSLGSTTAWFYKPYLDAPNTSGLQATDTLQLRNWILSADSANLQIAIHAIGDRANDWVLNTFEVAEQKTNKDHRFRIEHAQHLTPQAILRFTKLNVTASMQPYHLFDDGSFAYKRLDDTRLKTTYAFNDLLKTNARLTFGSDWTVAPLKPLLGIYAAVTRHTSDNKNKNGWYPQQKITVAQALKCYTVNNAYAIFNEDKTGMLKEGLYADFVILSDNIFTINKEQIKNVKVLKTFINGNLVYELK